MAPQSVGKKIIKFNAGQTFEFVKYAPLVHKPLIHRPFIH